LLDGSNLPDLAWFFERKPQDEGAGGRLAYSHQAQERAWHLLENNEGARIAGPFLLKRCIKP